MERIGVAISPTYCEIKTVRLVLKDFLGIDTTNDGSTSTLVKLARKYSKPIVLGPTAIRQGAQTSQTTFSHRRAA